MNGQQQMSQGQLLNWINMVSFAVYDTALFLDTHPCDKEALAYYNNCSRLRNQALHEYARLYGPLTLDYAADCDNEWKWVQTPWPWEGSRC